MIVDQGFTDVRVLGINTPFKGITITKTRGQHGSDEMYSIPIIAEKFGDVMGFVFKAEGYKTVFFAGDTIFNDYVELAMKKFKPDIIVVNAAEGVYEGLKGSSIMGRDDVKKIYEMCKDAKIIPVHFDSFCHGLCDSEKMKKFVEENKLQDRVIVPFDGEVLKF